MGVAACAPPDGRLECGEEILDGIFPAVILIRNTALVASGGVLRLPAVSGTGIRGGIVASGIAGRIGTAFGSALDDIFNDGIHLINRNGEPDVVDGRL